MGVEKSRNPFREALGWGRPLIGMWSMLNSSTVVEGLAHSPFDWLLIDGEHSPVMLSDALSHLRAAMGSPIIPIVRIPWNDPVAIKQMLDLGAQTLMLPFVQNGQEAGAAARAMRYPPHGIRGLARIHRASAYGRDSAYVEHAQDAVALIVQIETITALDNLEEIASVEGVDAVFFGPGDMAASMGLRGQPAAEPVVEKIMDGLARLKNLPAAAGVLAPTPELAERYVMAGFDFVSVTNDAAILFPGADAIADRFRALAGRSVS
ncbi:MAG: HpcH/HpaI aldolase family protein [Alphaproteobacteria bacterium]